MNRNQYITELENEVKEWVKLGVSMKQNLDEVTALREENRRLRMEYTTQLLAVDVRINLHVYHDIAYGGLCGVVYTEWDDDRLECFSERAPSLLALFDRIETDAEVYLAENYK